MKETKIYFGLDLGTGSIGYAATDENYKIVKVGKKRAIGVRTYEENEKDKNDKTAAARRAYRTARRRLQRRKYRISLLQDLFCDEVKTVDENFFVKLNENTLRLEDRTFEGAKYSLFNDKNYTDKQFYRDYPTIYHLRKKLLEEPADDIRLLYLAVHHIIKYRGNFLTENKGASDDFEPHFKPHFEKLNLGLTLCQKAAEDETGAIRDIKPFSAVDSNNLNRLEEIIKDGNLPRKDKIKEAYEILKAETRAQKELVDAIFGNKVKLVEIFGKEKYAEAEFGKPSFTFADDFETIGPLLEAELEEYEYNIIFELKNLYDCRILTKLLGGKRYLSEAMVSIYDKHKSDLKDLKYIVEKYAGDKYDELFGEPPKEGSGVAGKGGGVFKNYTDYIGGGFYGGAKLGKKYVNGKLQIDDSVQSRNGRLGHTCTADEFYATVKKIIEKLEIPDKDDAEKKDRILKDIANKNFMPKIVSKNNSTIPYWLNMAELKKILEVSSKKYLFLNEMRDDDEYSVMQKIEKLLEFRIPYYVGPLKYYSDEDKNVRGWAKRRSGKEKTRITPWNFDSVIDKDASREAFISKMTVGCTYLKGEKTLPKKSILYCAFVCLNELNKLKINDEPISVELKQKIFKEVYLKEEKPTAAKIKEYLKKNSPCGSALSLSLRDEDMHGDMKVYIDFNRIIGDKTKDPKIAEDLAFIMTIFADSPDSIEEHIRKEYGEILTEDQIKKLKDFKYKGWGRLSEGLIRGSRKKIGEGITLTDEYGNTKDIIDILWETNLNFMEIINDPRYNFREAMKKYNRDNGITLDSDIKYDDIDALYCSPSVKRCLWQSYKVVGDLVKNIGVPTKIFIESTRRNDDKLKKKRTLSRREQLKNLYEKAKDMNKEYFEDCRCAEKLEECDNGKLRAEKYFLYFLQLGRDMYSGKPIDLDNLNDYDVDHIIPRVMLKDDSFDNKVLVSRPQNNKKSDEYPLKEQFRQRALWNNLYKMKLMSDEKYQRLTRSAPVSEDERKGFINRQLVETAQAVKALKDLLARHFDDKVEIVMSKAANVSEFRKDNYLTKSREANDFHHACDAYLNIVVGNVLNEKFNHSADYRGQHIEYDKRDNCGNKSANFLESFNKKVYSVRENRCIWYPKNESESTLKVVEKEISGYDFNMSKMLLTGKGELYCATIHKAGVAKYGETYPLNEGKLRDTAKYGFKTSSGTAYFAVVDSRGKNGAPKRTIEAVPIFYDKKISSAKQEADRRKALEAFLRNNCKLTEPSLAKIEGLNNGILLKNSLLDLGKYKLRLTGAKERRLIFHNANELYVSKEQNDYIKELSVVAEKVKKEFNLRRKDSSLKDKSDEENLKNAIFDEIENEKTRRQKSKDQKSIILHVDVEQNLRLYDFFIDKLTSEKSPYTFIPAYDKFAEILIAGRENFKGKSAYDGMTALMKLIVAFQCNAGTVDSSDIIYYDEFGKRKAGGKHQCSILLNKDISNKKIVFISQSPTGLKEKRIPLN